MPMPPYEPTDDDVRPGVPVPAPPPNAGWVGRRVATLARVRAAGAAGVPVGRGDGAGDPPDAVSPVDANTLEKTGLVRVEKGPDGARRVYATV